VSFELSEKTKAQLSRGAFLTIDGMNGAGKSTLCVSLSHYLINRGFHVLHVREPGATLTGEKLRAILLDPNREEMTPLAETFLFESARAEMVAKLIASALREGRVVICDRWVGSTFAYQTGPGRLEVDDVIRLHGFIEAMEGGRPDLNLVLDISVEQAMKRMADSGRTDNRYIHLPQERYQHIHKMYRWYSEQPGQRTRRVPATNSPNDVLDEAIIAISMFFEERSA
jgi:dTMP kinase